MLLAMYLTLVTGSVVSIGFSLLNHVVLLADLLTGETSLPFVGLCLDQVFRAPANISSSHGCFVRLRL